jgi:hypothetical protein
MNVTIEDLKKMSACALVVSALAELFGESVEVTETNILAAYAAGIDVDWWACQVFAEYQRVTAPAWAEYQRVTAPALAEYQRVRARLICELAPRPA